jgi:hypothetical protein
MWPERSGYLYYRIKSFQCGESRTKVCQSFIHAKLQRDRDVRNNGSSTYVGQCQPIHKKVYDVGYWFKQSAIGYARILKNNAK